MIRTIGLSSGFVDVRSWGLEKPKTPLDINAFRKKSKGNEIMSAH